MVWYFCCVKKKATTKHGSSGAIEYGRFFTNLLDQVKDPVIATDLSYSIVGWNEAAEELYGYSKKEALGAKVPELIPPRYVGIEVEEVVRIMKSGGVWKGEVKQFRKDGTEISVLTSMSAVKDASGEIIGLMAVNKDITELKRLEEKRNEFISLASHELKTPVTSLKIYAGILERECSPYPKASEYVRKIGSQIESLSSIVNDLLDVSRIERGALPVNFSHVDLGDVARLAVEDMRAAFPRRKIRFENEGGCVMRADHERVRQVIVNLLSNAVTYSPEKEPIDVSVSKNGETVILRVRDRGIGIPKEHRDLIFKLFYRVSERTHDHFPGLGIGLYISSEIAKAHGGAIRVESPRGRGSVFVVEFPYKAGKR